METDRSPTDPRRRRERRAAEALSRLKITNHLDNESMQHLFPIAEQAIGMLAPIESVRRVHEKNADSVWLFSRIDGARPEGFQAFLLLNPDGRERILKGEFDLFDPPLDCLVGQSETPALIYVWATYTPGILAAGILQMIDHFSSPRYAGVDMVSWAAGIRGERAMLRTGFTKGLSHKGIERPELFILARSTETLARQRPRYDSFDAVTRSGIKVVHEMSELLMVSAIRSAVYIGEQNCPFAEEFDGNDFAATHLIGFINGEPAGCMRIRFFGRFAKVERLAVRKEYRTSRLSFQLVRAAVDLCRSKGYATIYGHAKTEYLRFWRHFGFDLRKGIQTFPFSDSEYVELRSEFSVPNDAVSLEDGPYRLIRPEGRWHRPGVLEASAQRSASRNARQASG